MPFPAPSHVARAASPIHYGLMLMLAALMLLLNGPAQAQSLYADARARQTGDVLTIILAEETRASRRSSYDDRADASMNAGAGVESASVSGTFGLDANFSNEASTSNETFQSDLLRGTLTARVVDTDDAGNLIVEGTRTINVNGVTHIMRVSGTVRPFDVRTDNTLFSYEMANAEVIYRQSGIVHRYTSPGFLAKVGAVAAIGAAIFFGAQ